MDTAPFVLDVGLPEAVKAMPADGDVVIEGFAADFEPDREGERFLPGAFDRACEKAGTDAIPLLHEHDNNRQLGVVERLEVRPEGLWVRARIAKAAAGSWAEDVVGKIERGMMRGLSVRGLVKVAKGMISDLDLAEVSVTPVPMQPGALFAVASKSLNYAADPAGPAADIAWADPGNDNAWRARGQLEDIDPKVQAEAFAYIQAKIDEARAALAAAGANLSHGKVE